MSAKDFAEQHDGQQVEIDNRPGEGPFIVRGYTSPDRVVMEAPATWKGTGKGYDLADLGRRHYGTNWTSVVPAPGSDTRFCLRPVHALTVVASAVGAAYAAATTKPFHQQFAEQYDGQQVVALASGAPFIVRGYCVNMKRVLLEAPHMSNTVSGYSRQRVADPACPIHGVMVSEPTDPYARIYAKNVQDLTLAATGVQPAVQTQATVSGVPEHVRFFNDHVDEEVEIGVSMGTQRTKARVIGYGNFQRSSKSPSVPMILLDIYGFVGRRGPIGATIYDTITRRRLLMNAVLSTSGQMLDPRTTMTVMREVADITLIQGGLRPGNHVIAVGPTGGRSFTPTFPGGASIQHPATTVDRVTRDSLLRQVFCGPPAPKAKIIDDYPGTCPRCKGPAYISALSVDCKARCH
jgi:hypothetical protein